MHTTDLIIILFIEVVRLLQYMQLEKLLQL
ncbi:hypothetical protein ACVWY1_001146 [Pseudomonas sp. TE6288]